MTYPSEGFAKEENAEGEDQGSYIEDIVEAKIENAVVRYEYAPVESDVEANEEPSGTSENGDTQRF